LSPAATAVPTAAELAALLDADGVLVYAIEGQALTIVDIYPAHPSADNLRLQVGFGVTGLVARTRKPVLLDADSPRNILHRQLLRLAPQQTVARMCLPLPGVRGEVVGVLAVHRAPHQPFGQADLDVAEPYAAALGLRLHAEQLWRAVNRHRTERDELIRQAVSAQEAERRRIAFDLHDGVTTALASMSFHLSAVDLTVSELAARDDSGNAERMRALECARAELVNARELADLAYNHTMVVNEDWTALSTYFKKGQDLYQTLAAAPVPVVAAAHGFALGGGCELILHSHAVVAHAGLRAGLPEIKVGLIPAWGGCTQLLLRCVERFGPEDGLAHALSVLQAGSFSASAEQAQAIGLLRSDTPVVADRAALLPAAFDKARAMMNEGFTPPAQPTLTYCGESGHAKHVRRVDAAVADGSLDQDSAVVMRELVGILSGFPKVAEEGEHPITVSLAGELASAGRLIKTKAALAAITKLIGA